MRLPTALACALFPCCIFTMKGETNTYVYEGFALPGSALQHTIVNPPKFCEFESNDLLLKSFCEFESIDLLLKSFCEFESIDSLVIVKYFVCTKERVGYVLVIIPT